MPPPHSRSSSSTTRVSTMASPLHMTHYSPLFTLGLLSDRTTLASFPLRSPSAITQFRKASLPASILMTVPSCSSHTISPDNLIDDGSSVFDSTPHYAMQNSDPRDAVELRSFLSLDLAETHSMRSAKPRRPKLPGPTRSTWFGDRKVVVSTGAS